MIRDKIAITGLWSPDLDLIREWSLPATAQIVTATVTVAASHPAGLLRMEVCLPYADVPQLRARRRVHVRLLHAEQYLFAGAGRITALWGAADGLHMRLHCRGYEVAAGQGSG